MAIDQLIYTSCRNGVSGRAGFQVFSMSKGITEEERKEIETHCFYIPPSNLTSQPNKEEIEELFPKVFSYYKLSNGKWAIMYTKFLGKDYSGRFGNYYCHVYVFNDEKYIANPVGVYGSNSFIQSFDESELSSGEVKQLSSINTIEKGSIINEENSIAFAVKHRKAVLHLLNLVFKANEKNKRIVFSCENELALKYIATVNFLLPEQISREFSFISYTQRPLEESYFLSGVLASGARFSSYALQNHPEILYVDLERESNEIEPNNRKYLITLNALLQTNNIEQIKNCLSFITKFQDVKLTSINKVAKVYDFIYFKETKLSLNELDEVIRISKENGHHIVKLELLNALIGEITKDIIEVNNLKVILEFLLESITKYDLQEHLYQKSIGAIFNQLDRLIMQNDSSLNEHSNFLKKVIISLPSNEWISHLMNEERLSKYISSFSSLQNDKQIYLGELLLDCHILINAFQSNKPYIQSKNNENSVECYAIELMGSYIAEVSLDELYNKFNKDKRATLNYLLYMYSKVFMRGKVTKLLMNYLKNEVENKELFWNSIFVSQLEDVFIQDLYIEGDKNKEELKFFLQLLYKQLFQTYKKQTSIILIEQMEYFCKILEEDESLIVEDWLFVLEKLSEKPNLKNIDIIKNIIKILEEKINETISNISLRELFIYLSDFKFHKLIHMTLNVQKKYKLDSDIHIEYLNAIENWKTQGQSLFTISDLLFNLPDGKIKEKFRITTLILIFESTQIQEDLEELSEIHYFCLNHLWTKLSKTWSITKNSLSSMEFNKWKKKVIYFYFLILENDNKVIENKDEIINTIKELINAEAKTTTIRTFKEIESELNQSCNEFKLFFDEYTYENMNPIIRNLKFMFKRTKRNKKKFNKGV
ncbi:hypothetical protein CIB95_11715 [Lottiidibacillus patelloidae]|uniref:Uncharacterized protein n=1 Tax=Lottiidibacillus patelloidae TaxID=2670334 RepID=A0A263BRV9_9BACI|nr:hypothetical protein [Lottiidibacillus patelloidae]OZM56435.1 hypothetical protein CIB95_11715 [Lottiidibacillus patelloidae]